MPLVDLQLDFPARELNLSHAVADFKRVFANAIRLVARVRRARRQTIPPRRLARLAQALTDVFRLPARRPGGAKFPHELLIASRILAARERLVGTLAATVQPRLKVRVPPPTESLFRRARELGAQRNHSSVIRRLRARRRGRRRRRRAELVPGGGLGVIIGDVLDDALRRAHLREDGVHDDERDRSHASSRPTDARRASRARHRGLSSTEARGSSSRDEDERVDAR